MGSNNTFSLLLIVVISMTSCGDGLNKTNNVKDEALTLKEKFNNAFFIGAALNEDQIEEKEVIANELLKNEFNSITNENNLKWMYIHPKPNSFYFDIADKYVALGEKNDMHIVGHTLVWHSQIAPFMNEVKDSATMAGYIKSHIETVVGRYKSRIHSWDVVNEALSEDGSLRASLFYKVVGKNYIKQAFQIAHQSDSQAELTYNDYNLCNPKKREGALRLIKDLQESGTKIDAVGIQAHWQLNSPSLEEIEKSIIAYHNLGVKVMFTELDVSPLPNPWELVGAGVEQDFKKLEGDPTMNPYPVELPEDIQIKLADRYENIFKLFLKHKDKISRVTFWGLTDKHSWLNNFPIRGRTNYPLLFDRNYQPKKAYKRILKIDSLH